MVKKSTKKHVSREKYIVTSALPYVNGIKHLGNFIGSLLPADVFTRYLKAQGHDAIYICATDDHGTPSELGALEENLPIKEYVKKYHDIQEQIYKDFGLEFEIFGNTSNIANHEITQHLFLKLRENDLIQEQEIVQLYSIDDKRFLPDRFVRGTCPYCGYENARGDQCESCTQVLDPLDLINPRSAISDSPNVEPRSTKHLFIDLPQMQNQISAWVESKKDIWPKTSYTIAKKWLNEGLRSRSITRDLKWGIKVPVKGYENKVFYVWFDAPIGYIGATIEWSQAQKNPDLWKDYWLDEKTKLYQFMGKDNVPFHTVTWPATMMGANDGFILAEVVKGFEWLNYEGGKFSTSQRRGVFLDQALAEYPADYWRYYLILIAPERHDTDFTWLGFQSAVNGDLANMLGNFVHRTLTFVLREFDGQIPPANNLDKVDRDIINKVQSTAEEIKINFNQLEFQKALGTLRQFWSQCNSYFQEKQPWRLVKEDKEYAKTVLAVCAYLSWACAILARPFLPQTSEKIFGLLGISPKSDLHTYLWSALNRDTPHLTGITVPPNPKPLFSKIDDKEITKLVVKFGGDNTASIKATDVKGRQKKKKKDSTKKSITSEITQKNVKIDDSLPEGLISISDFKKADIRIGKILSAIKVEGSNKLIQLEVQLHESSPRQIIAGVAEYYQSEELINKSILVVANLEPKKLKGLESQGMLLAATPDNKKQPYVIFVDETIPIGAKLG
ncbi:MAG: methionine--tRNA ligase [Candidatus Thorarchaeota archaeon]